ELAGLKTFSDRLRLEYDTEQMGFRLRLMYWRWNRGWKELAAGLGKASAKDGGWVLGWGLRSLCHTTDWCVCHYEHGLAFGPLVHCQPPEDLPLLDVLLGAEPLEPDKVAPGRAASPDGPRGGEGADDWPAPVRSQRMTAGPECRPWLVRFLNACA